MALLDLINTEPTASRRDVILTVVVSALANTAILATINSAARKASGDHPSALLFAIYAVAIVLYIIGFTYTFRITIKLFEHAIASARMRIASKIANAELLILDQVGKARIYQSLTQDTTVILEAQGLLVAGAQSSVMIIFTSFYVITLSFPAFIAIAIAISVGSFVYISREKTVMRLMDASAAEDVRFIGAADDLVGGLKEVKLSWARGHALIADMDGVAARLRDSRIKMMNLYSQNAVFTQTFFYLLLGVLTFILPRLLHGFQSSVPSLVATTLFIIGPLSTIVTALPALSKSNRAATSLMQLEAEISLVVGGPAPETAPKPARFSRTLGCRGLEFHYPHEDPSAFRVGPIDLLIPHGEITMFVGGNGSGKTTLLKLLAGLYPPTAGALTLDEEAVQTSRLPNYRELFGAIFSDFHLFPKLYGIIAEEDAIDAELERMKIAGKTSYGPDGFSTLGLSTGQRKRVAMAVARLEDRPILIFDEWAAEQDPGFRKYFYEELLPELKGKKKTLLIATHDDRYFGAADTVVTMEFGCIQSIKRRPER